MLMALKGHFLGQMPQPIHSRSEMKAIFDSGATSMQSLPDRTTGQDFLHSCRHFYITEFSNFKVGYGVCGVPLACTCPH